jgi:hypothetical protein
MIDSSAADAATLAGIRRELQGMYEETGQDAKAILGREMGIPERAN